MRFLVPRPGKILYGWLICPTFPPACGVTSRQAQRQKDRRLRVFLFRPGSSRAVQSTNPADQGDRLPRGCAARPAIEYAYAGGAGVSSGRGPRSRAACLRRPGCLKKERGAGWPAPRQAPRPAGGRPITLPASGTHEQIAGLRGAVRRTRGRRAAGPNVAAAWLALQPRCGGSPGPSSGKTGARPTEDPSWTTAPARDPTSTLGEGRAQAALDGHLPRVP